MTAITEAENGTIDHTARGMARDALQAVESFMRVSEERWANQRREWDEARRVMQNINAKMDTQHAETREQIRTIQVNFEIAQKDNAARVTSVDKTYNSRFWQVAGGIIVTLVSVLGVILAHDFLH